jgi:hypothetical protein
MHFATLTTIAVLLAAAALHSCKDGPAPREDATADGPIVKIWITKAGTVELNGRPAKLDAVGKALDDLVKQKGKVYYGRDDSEGPTPELSTKVIQLVIDRRLPIRLSTRKDFSDYVGEDGESHTD